MSQIALYAGSPACIVGAVDFGGFNSIDVISVVACIRKSFHVNAGKGILCRKNSTVSMSISTLVLGA